MGIPATCERTRAFVSRSVDGDISEFEHWKMRAHLRRCSECDAFAEQVRWFTEALRAAPLEPLTVTVATSFRRHRRRSLTRVGSAAAAAAVVVFGVGSSLVHELSTQRQGSEVRGRLTLPRATNRVLLDDRLNWPGGLPRVKQSDLPLPIGQRTVAAAVVIGLPTPGPADG